jgi:hypothetical protein
MVYKCTPRFNEMQDKNIKIIRYRGPIYLNIVKILVNFYYGNEGHKDTF